MNFYIIKLKVSGIKNIQNDVELKFFNNIRTSKFNPDKSNIKAIYGPNGAGKSAIMHSMEIYKDLLLDQNYLLDNRNNEYVKQLINNFTNKFNISLEFVLVDEKSKIIFHGQHSISLTKQHKDVSISNESYISFKVPGSSKTSDSIIYIVEDGKLMESELSQTIEIKTFNLLQKRSLVEIYMNDIKEEYDKDKDIDDDLRQLFPVIGLCIYSTVFTEGEDSHHFYLNRITQSNLLKQIEKKSIEGIIEDFPISNYSDKVRKEDFDDYKIYIGKLYEFLKIFKNDLRDISIEKKEYKDHYIVDPYFHYDGYKVFVEFESNGIKKLVRLFNALRHLAEGRILFIDEFDANINDIYLMKLIEYFSNYCNGQLIFTTHNIGPMEVLAKSKNKHAVDFITDDNSVVSWKKNGNYSIVNSYRNGMIDKLPFNLEAFDFIKIFGED